MNKKKICLGVIIISFLYIIITFVISFYFITIAVVSNDHISLKRYMDINSLKKNFYKELIITSSSLENSINRNISINKGSFEFTGELNPNFVKKIFKKISKNLSADFSRPEQMLYFYFNSKEISQYLKKSISNFGNYDFEEFIKKDKISTTKDKADNKISQTIINSDKKSQNIKNISKLIKRIKKTNYFFLTSPIHFMISTKHQNIKFIVILRFNGLIWKLNKISIPYEELINLDDFNL